MLHQYINSLMKWHKWVILVSVLAILSLASGLSNLQFSSDFRIYFSKDNPQLKAFEQLEDEFSRQDIVFIYIEPKQGGIFTKKTLKLISELTSKAWDLPYAKRVNSLTNYQHTVANGDELVTDYLLPDVTKLDDTEISRIKNIVLNEPTLINNMSPADGRATGIRVQLNMPAKKNQASEKVVAAIRALITEFRNRYPDVKFLLGGNTSAGVTLGEAVAQDINILVSLSYVVIIILLLILLRSIRGMLITILLVTFSIVATMGIYGLIGHTLTPVAGWVPSIVMTIAVADSVHILISYFHCLRHGKSKNEAVFESIRINANPVFVTSLTTIIGVLCLNFSDSPPYRDLGNMVALGVLFAYLLSMTLLPAILFWLSLGKAHANRGESQWMDAFSTWIINNNRFLLTGMGLLFILTASFIPRNELTERWQEYFDDTFELRNTVESVNTNLSGVHYIHYILDSKKPDGIHDPAYLNTLDKFASWYRKQNGVAYVSTLADISRRLNKTLHSDKKEWYIIPDNRELAAQLFLLYEIGLPRELNLDDTVNQDRSATILTAIVHKTDSEKLLRLDRLAQQWLTINASQYQVKEGTGLDMVFSHLNHRNIHSLLKGSLLALILISFVLIFALKSIRLGLISLIPNLAPAAMAYGTWGFFIGRIDLSASVVICMSLGIVVDDTVHFLSKYLRARRENNYDIRQAMHYAFHTVGVALTITTVVLVAGFLVLVASHLSPTWVSGLLMAITLSFALLADFLLLPPLLMVLDSRVYKRN